MHGYVGGGWGQVSSIGSDFGEVGICQLEILFSKGIRVLSPRHPRDRWTTKWRLDRSRIAPQVSTWVRTVAGWRYPGKPSARWNSASRLAHASPQSEPNPQRGATSRNDEADGGHGFPRIPTETGRRDSSHSVLGVDSGCQQRSPVHVLQDRRKGPKWAVLLHPG